MTQHLNTLPATDRAPHNATARTLPYGVILSAATRAGAGCAVEGPANPLASHTSAPLSDHTSRISNLLHRISNLPHRISHLASASPESASPESAPTESRISHLESA
jgi:hypothetical protein